MLTCELNAQGSFTHCYRMARVWLRCERGSQVLEENTACMERCKINDITAGYKKNRSHRELSRQSRKNIITPSSVLTSRRCGTPWLCALPGCNEHAGAHEDCRVDIRYFCIRFTIDNMNITNLPEKWNLFFQFFHQPRHVGAQCLHRCKPLCILFHITGLQPHADVPVG